MANGGQSRWIAWIGAGAAVVGAFVALYGVLHHPDTSVADYQRQVRATCGRVHALLTADHSGEILGFGADGGFPTGPGDLFRVNKGALLNVLRGNLQGAEEEFELLNAKQVPKSLATRKERAVAAQRAWSRAFRETIGTVDQKASEGMTLTRLNAILGGGAGSTTITSARLNAAMTSLAGDDCRVTA